MTDIARLADALNATNPFLADDERGVALAIYELLSGGAPANPSDIAAAAGLDVTRVEALLDNWTGVFRNDGGSVVGFWGLALGEMDHRFEVEDRILYTWCAWDPFFIAPLIGKIAKVTSTCPVSGQAVTLEVGPNGVHDVDPSAAVLSFLEPCADMREDVINSFCHFVRLFVSREAADEWVAEHPATFVLGVEDAFALASATFGRLNGQRAS